MSEPQPVTIESPESVHVAVADAYVQSLTIEKKKDFFS
jgi:hypothetical protein